MGDVTVISSSIIQPGIIDQSGQAKIHLITPFDLNILYLDYTQRGLLFSKPARKPLFFPVNGVRNIHGVSEPLLAIQVTEIAVDLLRLLGTREPQAGSDRLSRKMVEAMIGGGYFGEQE
ncbi:unnamed protein product [Arabis nemorensis]|uniref:Uncharacterized protein n=1 Tax=Arabis nemorensis TaxID=586526 RepID=A0A565BUT6_9BRAS|nr:unnamed protein product [Arabis nemorensis]